MQTFQKKEQKFGSLCKSEIKNSSTSYFWHNLDCVTFNSGFKIMQTKESNLQGLASYAWCVSEFGHDNPRVSKFSYVGQNIARGYGFFLYM